MRRIEQQLSLTRPGIEHVHTRELEEISRILRCESRMAELVAQDLIRGVDHPDTGAPGLTGEQVLRILVIKQMNGFSYEELAFHLADSVTYRRFCAFGALERTPARSTLAENLKKVREETLEAVQQLIVEYAARAGVEKGRKVRIDATVTETNIHDPTDSSLLFDGVRVLTRLYGKARERFGFTQWSNHTKRAKRRMLEIQHTGSKAKRTAAYRDLLRTVRMSTGYAERATEVLEAQEGADAAGAQALLGELRHYLDLIRRVVDQTERRVLQDEKVAAEDKVVSLFEPHTDIIVKDRRDVLYGHKVYLTGGASGLITDCVITDGNPADSTLATKMLERQQKLYGRPPRQASFDGGFASKENLREAKALGVRDVCFSKKRGLKVTDMVKSTWVYKRLRDFRAGIEGVISFLKRAFGLERCSWRGKESFAAYVRASVVSANLLMLARHALG